VNASNYISVRNRDTVFRAYVGKGNNGVLIKELLKKRWWWHIVDHPSKANLLWTEWFNADFLGQMPEETARDRNHIDYSPPARIEEPKVTSVRKIVDASTFSRIRPHISLR
jgi:hypothetical protein